MMRTLISCVVLVGLGIASTASAQPGADPTTPPPAGPPPTYPPAPQQPAPVYVPPPYQYQQPAPVMLSPEDQDLLSQGEITDGQHIGGGLASVFLGWGIGQAIQGRWSETGWIFTLGEAASLTAIIYGISQEDCFLAIDCEGDDGGGGEGFIIGGIVGILVFRVWEVVDAFAGPPRHNRKVRELRMRLGYPPVMYGKRMTPFVVPPRDGAGAVAGVSLHF
jgi:hypothetical protein